MGDVVRDDNRVTAWLGVSSADGTTPLPVLIDPTTGRVLVEAPGGGGGDVIGPGSSTDNAIARFDGVTGLLLQESIVILGNTGTMASTGDLGFSDQYQAGSGYATPLILSDASAEWDTFETNFGEVSLLNAINQAVAGGGDVSKVGTPANSQIGVWTGDGTIEGAASLTYDGANLQMTGDIGSTGTRITKGWLVDLQVTNAIAGSITGNAATVSTITGLAPDTATTQATQPNITSLGTLGDLTVTNPIVGDITGNAGTVTTITGLAPDTATTQATQPNITSAANLVTVGTITTGVWNGTDIAVADGGTGRSSNTAYAVICGGTTTTALQQSVSGVGASGQILTSNGAAALPTWQAAPDSGNTLDQAYDQGGAGVGRAIDVDSGAVTMTVSDTDNNACLELVQNDITNDPNALTVTNSANGNATDIVQSGVLAAAKYGLRVYSNAAQVNAPLIMFEQDNVSSTEDLLDLKNDGTGTGLELIQNGVLASVKHGIHILTSANQNQASASLLTVEHLNSLSVATLANFQNTGIGTNVNIAQNTDLAASEYALHVHSGVAQTNSPLIYVHQDHASSTKNLLELQNDGSGDTISITDAGIGDSLYISNNNVGNSINIFSAIDDASDNIAIKMNISNIGAGDPYAMRFDGAEIVSASVGGTQDKKIRCSVSGVDYFIPLHTA